LEQSERVGFDMLFNHRIAPHGAHGAVNDVLTSPRR
jgi:hypothetical protein